MREESTISDRERLGYILQAAHDALVFSRGRSRGTLDQDRMLLRALANCVQVIGEASNRMSDAGRSRAPAVPWAKLGALRHAPMRNYYRIDADAVWRAVEETLPPLVRQLEIALANWAEE